MARFLACERSSWQTTTMPVGSCVKRTAVATLFTFCPPALLAWKMSVRTCDQSISTSTSSASGSTATVAVEVWMRPCDSVSGTRWTRCTPDSCFIRR